MTYLYFYSFTLFGASDLVTTGTPSLSAYCLFISGLFFSGVISFILFSFISFLRSSSPSFTRVFEKESADYIALSLFLFSFYLILSCFYNTLFNFSFNESFCFSLSLFEHLNNTFLDLISSSNNSPAYDYGDIFKRGGKREGGKDDKEGWFGPWTSTFAQAMYDTCFQEDLLRASDPGDLIKEFTHRKGLSGSPFIRSTIPPYWDIDIHSTFRYYSSIIKEDPSLENTFFKNCSEAWGGIDFARRDIHVPAKFYKDRDYNSAAIVLKFFHYPSISEQIGDALKKLIEEFKVKAEKDLLSVGYYDVIDFLDKGRDNFFFFLKEQELFECYKNSKTLAFDKIWSDTLEPLNKATARYCYKYYDPQTEWGPFEGLNWYDRLGEGFGYAFPITSYLNHSFSLFLKFFFGFTPSQRALFHSNYALPLFYGRFLNKLAEPEKWVYMGYSKYCYHDDVVDSNGRHNLSEWQEEHFYEPKIKYVRHIIETLQDVDPKES